MTKQTAVKKSSKPANLHRAASKRGKDPFDTIDSYLPSGSPQRATAGIVAAAGGALLAAVVLGVGPAALAGAAGYLVYRETR